MDQFIANGLCKGAIYALVALGFGLIYTTAGVFHIAHGIVFTTAAYAAFAAISLLHLPSYLADFLALVVAAGTGLLIEATIYRPLDKRKASSSVLMISSFGAYIVGVNLIAMLFGNETKVLRSGVDATFQLGDVILTRIQLLQLAWAGGVFMAYWLFLRRTALGQICRAVADDSNLASVLGVRVEATRLLVFAIGSGLAAVGAILTALDVGMDPHGGLPVVMAAAVACIIGGLHRFLAPVLGGMILGLLQSLVVWKTSAHWETVVTFAILILLLLFRPQGILGRAERLEEVR